MDLGLQSKLLRFLQSRQVQRLGEDRVRVSDVRIVCATNRNPVEEVKAGRFREDLFYRLHVIPVELPPLRARGEDIVEIARSFLLRFAEEDGKDFKDFSPDAAAFLLSYDWPGNVRQLQNVIRSVVVLNDGETVTADMLPLDMLGSARHSGGEDGPAAPELTRPLAEILARARLMPGEGASGEIRPSTMSSAPRSRAPSRRATVRSRVPRRRWMSVPRQSIAGWRTGGRMKATRRRPADGLLPVFSGSRQLQ